MGDDTQARRISAMRAVAHPARLRILSLLTGAEMSAAQIARELGLTQANVSYHLRVLAQAGEVEEAGRVKIRGGVARLYRHPWDRERPPSDRPDEDRELYLRATGDELVRRSRLRAPGTLQWLADAEVSVPRETWDRAFALVREATALIHEEARPAGSPGTVPVSFTATLFELARPAEPGVRR